MWGSKTNIITAFNIMGRVTEGGRKGENFNKGHAANIQEENR